MEIWIDLPGDTALGPFELLAVPLVGDEVYVPAADEGQNRIFVVTDVRHVAKGGGWPGGPDGPAIVLAGDEIS